MRFRVFSQAPEPSLPLEVFEAPHGEVGACRATPSEGLPLPGAIVRVTGGLSEARLLARPRTAADLDDARAAARHAGASGMDDLAARCPTVIEVEAGDGADERWLLELCALLAAACLGPILPPDGRALLGVRSARLRARSEVGSPPGDA